MAAPIREGPTAMAFPARRAPAHDLAKWAFFGVIGLCTVLVFFTVTE